MRRLYTFFIYANQQYAGLEKRLDLEQHMKDDSVSHTKTTHGRGWARWAERAKLARLCMIRRGKGRDSPLFVTRDREGYAQAMLQAHSVSLTAAPAASG